MIKCVCIVVLISLAVFQNTKNKNKHLYSYLLLHVRFFKYKIVVANLPEVLKLPKLTLHKTVANSISVSPPLIPLIFINSLLYVQTMILYSSIKCYTQIAPSYSMNKCCTPSWITALYKKSGSGKNLCSSIYRRMS